MTMDDFRVGFMQGRLSSVVNGKIQEFPWMSWQQEFFIAETLGFRLMEWTLDQERLYENPLMTNQGQKEIKHLIDKHRISIPSLTGDCFMQSPFWKLYGEDRRHRKKDLLSILDACSKINISKVVIPLVDNGRLNNSEQEEALLEFLHDKGSRLKDLGIQIIFESDFSPTDLKSFIDKLSPDTFGINYDIGNSASMGFNIEEEISAYGDRVLNVHVKDRISNGTTVPLGEGSANFTKAFEQLHSVDYSGNYILQTARAEDGNHAAVLKNYKTMVKGWIANNGS